MVKIKKILYSACKLHGMSQSLIVFTASGTLETPNFGMPGGVTHPLLSLTFTF